MRKVARILLILILVPLLTPLLPQKAFAGDLGVKIRIDRLAISKATGGMICATPETTGVEASIQVIFPTGFTVNSTASNWTVTTTNLPSGAVALPGVGTATGVSGQTVTFPSNDLSIGTEYCFNFASSNTLTTPSSVGTYNGIVRTMNSSNQAIDYHAYAVSIVTNDNISVTATVAANPTDFDATLALTSPANGSFTPNTTLTYTLTYGNLLTYPASITVEAAWDLGTVQGNGSPSESILDYVIGSASNAYNSTPPVVDTVNRKIDWTISTIPGSTTNETVTFQLITNSSYTGSLPVTFTVNGRVLGPGTQTADSTVTSTFQNASSSTSSTSGGGSAGGDGLSDGRTDGRTDGLGPRPISNDLRINTIDIRTISQDQASIYISTNHASKLKVIYGTSINNLDETKTIINFAADHLVTLTKLKPHTRYYFRVNATDQDGLSAASDLYLLDTAQASKPPKVDLKSLIVTSQDVLLVDASRSQDQIGNFIIPNTANYSFKVKIDDSPNVKFVKAILRSKKVLGINSFQPETTSTDSVTVSEISSGHFVGRLNAGVNPGEYELILQVQDYNGNISEQKIADVTISPPLRIVNRVTKNAVEHAKITFYFYNQRLKIYELLTSSTTPIKNPAYSEPNGTVLTVLPAGKYRAIVNTLGYKEQSVEFTLNPNSTSNYPTIELTPLPFSILTLAQYYLSTAYDFFQSSGQALSTLRSSFRFFELISFLLITLLMLLLTVALSKRISVPIFLFPSFALYHVLRPFKKTLHTFLVHGSITALGSDEPIAEVLLYFFSNSGKVLGHAKSNEQGEFLIKIHEAVDIRITTNKKGFAGKSIKIRKSDLNDRIILQIEQTGKPPRVSINNLKWYIEYLLSTFFEAILITVLCIEIVFIGQFGITKVLPFIVVSVINILLWAENMRAARR